MAEHLTRRATNFVAAAFTRKQHDVPSVLLRPDELWGFPDTVPVGKPLRDRSAAQQASQQMNFEDPASQQADTIAQFDEAISELERAAGDFLAGPGRLRCIAAFERNADAFHFLVAKALKRNDARGLGLFIKIVDDEHHAVSERLRRGTPATSSTASVQLVDAGDCVVCGQRATARFGGQFWCESHLEDELRSRGMAA